MSVLRRLLSHKVKPSATSVVKAFDGQIWQLQTTRGDAKADDLTLNNGAKIGICSNYKALITDGTDDNATTTTTAIGTSDYTFTMHVTTPTSFASFHYCAGIGAFSPGYFLSHSSVSNNFGLFQGSALSFGESLAVSTEYVLTWMRRGSTTYGFINNRTATSSIAGTGGSISGTTFHLSSASAGAFFAENNIHFASLEVRSYSDAQILARHANLYDYFLQPRFRVINISADAAATAALTGTMTDTVNEDDITTGGKTIIITLTGDTFKAAGTGPIGSTADTQALIDGFDAASSPTNGWNNEVRDKALTSEVVRTSDTVATWTVAAQSGYDVSAQETITGTIPTDVLVTAAGAIIATPTFTVDFVSVAAGYTNALSMMGVG